MHAAVGLAAVRILLADLGEARYAAHVLLVGSAGWLLLSDLGLRNATQNEVSRCIAAGRNYRAVVGGGALGLLLGFPAWWGLVGLTSALAPYLLAGVAIEAGEAARAWGLAGSLGLVSSVGNLAFNVWYAERRGHLASAMAAFSALGILGCTLAVAASPWKGSLEAQIWAVLGPPAALSLLSGVRLAVEQGPTPPREAWRALRGLIAPGRGFLAIAVLSVLLLQLDLWMLASGLPGDAVVVYAVVSRPFDFVRVSFAALLQAVRPEWTHALELQDGVRFELLLARAERLGVAAVTGLAVLLAGFAAELEQLLAPERGLAVTPSLVLAFGVFEVLRTHANVHFMGLLAADALGTLARLLTVQVLAIAAMQLLLRDALGVAALPLGAGMAYAMVSTWAAPAALRRRLPRSRQAQASTVVRAEAASASRS